MNTLMVVMAAVAFAGGGLAMKYADDLTHLVPSLVVFGLFGFGAALQTLAMRGSTLSVTYLVVLGLEAVITSGLGVLVFHEGHSLVKVGGGVLMVLGAMLLRLGDA
jgi:multidrug transporter EmrE-like cation transporter